jgi:hypothetical protein
MAIKSKHLATLYSRTGDNAVSRANEIYTQLRALPLIEKLQAAEKLPDVFTEAIIIDHGDAVTESAARARLKSHFYVNSILTMDRAFHKCKIYPSRVRAWFIDHILNPSKLIRKVFAPLQLSTFQGDSSPVEARSLPSEMKVMLKTILAAHAPTAAKERSSLQPLTH